MAAGCAIEKAPGTSDEHRALALVDQGTVLLRSGDLDRAAAAFQVAYELARPAAAADGLGCVAFLRGDVLAAEKLFIQAYEMDENYSQSLANLALLYESRGLYSQAEAMYRRVIEEDPANFRARNNFAGLLFDNKKESGARVRGELLRGAAVQPHPLLKWNISKVEAQ